MSTTQTSKNSSPYFCHVCHEGISDGIGLYRQNKHDEPPIFACWEHNKVIKHNRVMIDGTVSDIVKTIEDHNTGGKA